VNAIAYLRLIRFVNFDAALKSLIGEAPVEKEDADFIEGLSFPSKSAF